MCRIFAAKSQRSRPRADVTANCCDREARMVVSEFVVAALLLELTPGPNMAYLATLSLTRGLQQPLS